MPVFYRRLGIAYRSYLQGLSSPFLYSLTNATPAIIVTFIIHGGSNMTGTNCDLFTHNQFRSYLNHLVYSVRGEVFVVQYLLQYYDILLDITHKYSYLQTYDA
jgi:hypothetical protein